jgi:hypothetical protein
VRKNCDKFFFRNSKLKAQNLQNVWDHWNNFLKKVKGQRNL